MERLGRQSRLVVRGFGQTATSDDVFASTPSLTTLLTLTIGSARNWHMSTGDVSTAFLHATLNASILIRPPPELQKTGHVWKLEKALYGLSTAPKAWSEHMAATLTDTLGFRRSKTDSCLYFCPNRQLWVLVYVDDLFVLSADSKQTGAFFNELAKHVLIKRTGELTTGSTLKFLGRRFTHRGTDVLIRALPNYYEELLELFSMNNCKGGTTPGTSLLKCPLHGDEPLSWDDYALYRTAVGRLLWIALIRPDITFSVKELARNVQLPTLENWHQLKHLLRYISKTRDYGLMLKPSVQLPRTGTVQLEIVAYGDTDWAGCKATRKSTTGCIAQLLGCTVQHCSRTQATVALSTCEAEVYGTGTTLAEGLYVKNLLL